MSQVQATILEHDEALELLKAFLENRGTVVQSLSSADDSHRGWCITATFIKTIYFLWFIPRGTRQVTCKLYCRVWPNTSAVIFDLTDHAAGAPASQWVPQYTVSVIPPSTSTQVWRGDDWQTAMEKLAAQVGSHA